MKQLKGYQYLFAAIALLLSVAMGGVQAANVANYMNQGGSVWGVGGTLNIVSGGVLDVKSGAALKVAGTTVSGTAAELNTLAGVTAGTVTASKALVVDSNKDLSSLRDVTLRNGTVTGTLAVTSTSAFTGAVTPTGGVAAAGGFAISPRNWHTGGNPASAAADGTDATPVNTEVYIAEVFVPANATLTGAAVFNGSVASGNLKVGLANSSGVVVATSASTTMSGTDAYQRVPFTGTYAAVGPATYYVLEFVDNNTARINTHVVGNFGAAKQTGQTYSTGFTTITAPSTFTTALGPIASLY